MSQPGRPRPLLTSEQAGEDNTTRSSCPAYVNSSSLQHRTFQRLISSHLPKRLFQGPRKPADMLPETNRSVTSPGDGPRGRKCTLSCPVPPPPAASRTDSDLAICQQAPLWLAMCFPEPQFSSLYNGHNNPYCPAVCGPSRAIMHEDHLTHTHGSVK